MKIGSLFSGIGGLELGLEWAGVGETIWQVEQDRHCLHWLARLWPNALRISDVRHVGANTLPLVDVICGGFPCQPHSVAGSRKAHNDDRDLWPEFRRIIRLFRPAYVVPENVPGLFTSDGGRFFNRVLSDLAEAGYDAEWDVLSAEDVGAPQGRERIFIISWLADADELRRRLERVAESRDEQREDGDLADRRRVRLRGAGSPELADRDVNPRPRRGEAGEATATRLERRESGPAFGSVDLGYAESGGRRARQGLAIPRTTGTDESLVVAELRLVRRRSVVTKALCNRRRSRFQNSMALAVSGGCSVRVIRYNLGPRECARQGCRKTFQPTHPTQKYCETHRSPTRVYHNPNRRERTNAARPIVSHEFERIAKEASQQLTRQRRDMAKFSCGREDPRDIHTFQGPRRHAPGRPRSA